MHLELCLGTRRVYAFWDLEISWDRTEVRTEPRLASVTDRALGQYFSLVCARARVRIFADSLSLTRGCSSRPFRLCPRDGFRVLKFPPLCDAGFSIHAVRSLSAYGSVRTLYGKHTGTVRAFREGKSERADHSRMRGVSCMKDYCSVKLRVCKS